MEAQGLIQLRKERDYIIWPNFFIVLTSSNKLIPHLLKVEQMTIKCMKQVIWIAVILLKLLHKHQNKEIHHYKLHYYNKGQEIEFCVCETACSSINTVFTCFGVA